MQSTAKQAIRDRAAHLYERGIARYNGDGVAKNLRGAFLLMRRAAALGHVPAQAALGGHYDYGIGVRASPALAYRYYRLAARAGNADAQYNVAACCYVGLGRRRNYRMAVKWLEAMNRAGIPEADYLLGCCYEHGRGVPRDRRRAGQLFRAAARLGHPDAHVEVGLRYAESAPARAVSWYRRAAQLNSAAGQYNLALCLERGRGARRSMREAMRWYDTAAKQGYADAREALERLRK